MPLVGVVVTTRDSARTLEACLRSIRAQEYPQIELIVVDNHSSDATLAIAHAFADRVFSAGPERSAQRNVGVAASSGEFVLIVDSDTVLRSDVVGACVACAGSGRAIAIPEVSFGKGFWAQCKSFERSFYHGDDVLSAARFFRRDAFLAVGGYDESLLGGEDWDLSMRIASTQPLVFAKAMIRHDEGALDLRTLFAKKYYYAHGYLRFVRKHGRDGRRRLMPVRGALLKNLPTMIRHPVLGAGLFIMKGTEVMGLLAGLAMHKRIPLTLLALALLVSGCGGPGGGTTLPSTGGGESSAGASQPSDWSTFGDGLARQGYNANETTLTSANVATLALQWKQNLGAAITAQSLYAAGVSIGGSLHDVLYIGTEGGLFYAIDAHTGAVLWQKQLGMLTNTCDDLESGEYGITDTATYDRATGRVYVVDGLDKLHALDMKSGKEISGWPVTVTPNSSQEHVYGALTYNPANHFIYVETASYCEDRPYQGRIVAVDTSSTAVVGTFLPSGTGDGGGIWGMGGASIDAATNDVFIGTGDDFGTTRHDDYAEHVIRFTPTLGIVAANYPTLVSGALDYDFGSTPMLFVSPGCPAQLSVKNKDGTLYVYGEDTIASGPLQSLEMADPTEGGRFIGVTTYSPATNMLYVGDPGGYGPYTYGIIALQVQPDCSLTLAWQMTEGVSTTYGDNIGATVANGVAYSNSGRAEEIFANDATTGALLWDSGTTIGGYAFAPPTVTAGHVYVGAWDDNLYAFGLP